MQQQHLLASSPASKMLFALKKKKMINIQGFIVCSINVHRQDVTRAMFGWGCEVEGQKGQRKKHPQPSLIMAPGRKL